MDLFDSLGNYSTYNQRLKLNQKRIIQINGNFDMANPNLIKMKKSYQDYKKNRTTGSGRLLISSNGGERFARDYRNKYISNQLRNFYTILIWY